MKIQVLQTSDATSVYSDYLDVSSHVNRAYCERHGYGYHQYRGIKRGFHSWQATLNRVVLFQEALDGGEYDWVFYVDADAIITDFDQTLESILQEDDNINKCFVLCTGCNGPSLADINAGVMFVNLKHPATRWILNMWRGFCELAMPNAVLQQAVQPWSIHAGRLLIDDQSTLSLIIHLLMQVHVAPALFRVYRGDQSERFNYDGGFIRQVIRASVSSPEERWARILETAQRTCQEVGLPPLLPPRAAGAGAGAAAGTGRTRGGTTTTTTSTVLL
jgi:hypothetical protein